MALVNTLAYYVTATITAVKSFIVQALGVCTVRRLCTMFYFQKTFFVSNSHCVSVG
jgi:hypothetical protein